MPTNDKASIRLIIFLGIVSLYPILGWGEESAPVNRKEVRAVNANGNAPKIDGKLEDQIWQSAVFVSDFLQKEPNEGAAPVESTKVAVLFDQDAIYFGAQMFSNSPHKIRYLVGRRDEPGNTERFIISLDTYLDRRTSYDFGINAAGVRLDRFHDVDNEYATDYNYDVVWEGESHQNNGSWTAEMRIPFSQLRFKNQNEQIWGVNFNRYIPARNEDVFWIYVPKNETAWASRFGNLTGISGIKPSSRIELLPYVASDGEFSDHHLPGDPYYDGSKITSRLGGDMKMGLGPNLTLDATINPDFGQVEADPATVNLTAYETFFEEKRPFFTEGSQIFAIPGPTYFYSRRIGEPPHGRISASFVDYPQNTTILGAAKLTGKLKSKTAIGVLAAVTGREKAEYLDFITDTNGIVIDSLSGKDVIEPPTVYNVFRAQQEFGKNVSTAGIALTAVNRDIDDGSPLKGILRKKAYTGGVDWYLRFKDGMYGLGGNAGFSYVQGDSSAIRRTQQNSTHYFQRPDQSHVKFDPTRTSLSGYRAALRLEKVSGKHWRWETGFGAESPGYELNDIGILGSADDAWAFANIVYRESKPGKIFHFWDIGFVTETGINFGGVRQYSFLDWFADLTWKNFWTTWLDFNIQARGYSDDRTRGGPIMIVESGWSFSGGVSNSYSGTTRYGLDFTYAVDEVDGWYSFLAPFWSTRAGNHWEFSVSPRYTGEVFARQYVSTLADPNPNGHPATYGSRYIFAYIERSTLSTQFRMNYFFSPDLTLEVYMEPFAASGRYYDHGELAAARTNDLRYYGTDGTTITENPDGSHSVTDGADNFTLPDLDFGFLSFRSNLVLRWEFRPGSTFYFVWQRNLAGEDSPGSKVGGKSLWDSFGLPGDDFLAVKVSYWWSHF